MRTQFLLVLIVLFSAILASCTIRHPPEAGPQQRHVPGTEGVLHLRCTWLDPYCGGMEISPEEAPRPQPWSGPLYIRKAEPDANGRAINRLSVPVISEVRTDPHGNGLARLPAGSYLIIDADRVDARKYRQLLRDFAKGSMHQEPIDTACMRQWLRGPFGVVTITAGDTLHLDFPQQGQCPWYQTPCVRYTGPLPP